MNFSEGGGKRWDIHEVPNFCDLPLRPPEAETGVAVGRESRVKKMGTRIEVHGSVSRKDNHKTCVRTFQEKKKGIFLRIYIPIMGLKCTTRECAVETVCRDYLRALIAPDFLTPL